MDFLASDSARAGGGERDGIARVVVSRSRRQARASTAVDLVAYGEFAGVDDADIHV